MGLVEWATSPFGEDVSIHIAFYLIWVSSIAGLAFLIGHAIWVRYFAKAKRLRERAVRVRASWGPSTEASFCAVRAHM